MKKTFVIILAAIVLDAGILKAEEPAGKNDATATDIQVQTVDFEIPGDGGTNKIHIKIEMGDTQKFAGKGFWIPLIAGYRHGDFCREWFIFPLLSSGSSNEKSGASDFFSPLYASAKKGFSLIIDNSNKDEVAYDLLFDEKLENDNASIELRSCPALMTFWCLVEGEKEHLSIFSALPLLTMTAGTSESYMFASAPLLTLYQSGKDTEKCSTLFGLLFDYEKGLKTQETSVMKGIFYSSDMDGVMDKRKIGPFGLLYSSTIKEDQKKYSSMWDFLFYYSSGVEKNEFGLGPFGLLYSHSGSAEEQERTSILYSILYESNKSADGKTQSWSFTPLFGVKKQNDELGLNILSINLF